MWDKASIYPKIETGYAFTRDMNDDLVGKLNKQTVTQGSAILKIQCYNPKNVTVQHIPVKQRVNKMEINQMRNGYNTQLLTYVDIQGIVKIGCEVFEIYEGVIYRDI